MYKKLLSMMPQADKSFCYLTFSLYICAKFANFIFRSNEQIFCIFGYGSYRIDFM